MKEYLLYYSIKLFALIIRILPLSVGLFLGKLIGLIVYYFDVRHKSLVYANLKMAFADTRSLKELKVITKRLFMNYGQNVIEFLRLPLMNPDQFRKLVMIEGEEHVSESLSKGKGLILLAMHFGSWEMASLSCGMLGHPYKVIVRPQEKYSKLDELLNTYRSCGGSIVLSRGLGTRDFVKSLKNNEIIGMVADQGGRDGMRVPFFGREASLSVGAIRMGLKWDVPVCFAIVIRQKNGTHKMVIHEPMKFTKTENMDTDIQNNLKSVASLMEKYITEYPSEYMWFYKIWKYSKEARITILSDQKTGHVRQSQLTSQMIQVALAERNIVSTIHTIDLIYRKKWMSGLVSLLSVLFHPFFLQGRLDFLKWFLTKESFEQITLIKTDFLVSCGSSLASLNYLVSLDTNAKTVVLQKPGILRIKNFDLVVLPQHDIKKGQKQRANVAITKGTPNLMTKERIEGQKEMFLNKFSHLKSNLKTKIGVFIGGNSKDIYLSEGQIKILCNQLIVAAHAINADILITTSRRTPQKIETLLYKQFKKHPRCPLLIIANQENVPGAVGGIIGLSEILIVSGDSISMVSEAATSGKKTIVFAPLSKEILLGGSRKHFVFMEKLNAQGFILAAQMNEMSTAIIDIAKKKIQTRIMDDSKIVLEAVKNVI